MPIIQNIQCREEKKIKQKQRICSGDSKSVKLNDCAHYRVFIFEAFAVV